MEKSPLGKLITELISHPWLGMEAPVSWQLLEHQLAAVNDFCLTQENLLLSLLQPQCFWGICMTW